MDTRQTKNVASIDKKSSRSFHGDLLLSTEMILDPGIVDRGEVLVARDPPAREHQQPAALPVQKKPIGVFRPVNGTHNRYT